MLFVVNKSYFTSRYYVKQAKWLELWREVTGDERITQVDVRRLKNSADKGAAEVAAYTAKDSEYMLSQEVFDVFYNALRGRQILTYNGLFTTGNKLFKSKQLDKFREKDTTEYVWILMYRWGMGEYIEAENEDLLQKNKNDLLDKWLRRQTMMNNKPTVVVPKDPKKREEMIFALEYQLAHDENPKDREIHKAALKIKSRQVEKARRKGGLFYCQHQNFRIYEAQAKIENENLLNQHHTTALSQVRLTPVNMRPRA